MCAADDRDGTIDRGDINASTSGVGAPDAADVAGCPAAAELLGDAEDVRNFTMRGAAALIESPCGTASGESSGDDDDGFSGRTCEATTVAVVVVVAAACAKGEAEVDVRSRAASGGGEDGDFPRAPASAASATAIREPFPAGQLPLSCAFEFCAGVAWALAAWLRSASAVRRNAGSGMGSWSATRVSESRRELVLLLHG